MSEKSINPFDPFGQGYNLLGNLEEENVIEHEEISRRFINALFVFVRSSWLYGIENDALKNARDAFSLSLGEFIARGEHATELRFRDESFFLNGELIKLDFSTYKSAQKLKLLFRHFDIDQVIFPLPLEAESLDSLSSVLSESAHSKVPFSSFASRCEPIVFRKTRPVSDYSERSHRDPRLEVLRLYSHALNVLAHFVDELKRGLRPRYSKIKRLCIRLIDLDAKYLYLLLAATQIPTVKGKLSAHMLNTAIYSLAFGRRLNLDQDSLIDLIMTAFYQHLAWALLDQVHQSARGKDLDTIEDIEEFRFQHRDEIKELRNHIAHLLLVIGGFNTKIISRLIVAYETQVTTEAHRSDLYVGDIDANFLTEVVAMASRYDQRKNLSPTESGGLRIDEVLREVIASTRTHSHFSLELFRNALGIYPIGTLVELNSGELAVVFDLPSRLEYGNRPRVKIVSDRMGQMQADGEVIDLSTRDVRGGYLKNIEHVHNGEHFGLSVHGLFFGGLELNSP